MYRAENGPTNLNPAANASPASWYSWSYAFGRFAIQRMGGILEIGSVVW